LVQKTARLAVPFQMRTCYNNPGVVSVSTKIDHILQEIEKLNSQELRKLFECIADKYDLLGMLKVAESSFADWDNPDDDVYDEL
jgi:hypothetical protein